MRLTRLDIAGLPGIPVGFTLEPGPGANVVIGPNTSGKSSLVRAVHSLLWPDAVAGAGRMRLTACFEIDGRELVARRGHDGMVAWEHEGRPVGAPTLPTAQLRDRYELGLLDLIAPDGRIETFAAAVRRQMTGGFDLDLTGASFFPRNGAQTTRKRNACLDADTALVRVAQKLEDLHRREGARDRLQADLQEATTAGARAAAVRAALAAHAAREELARAVEAISAFPANLAGFRPDDPEMLTAARGHLRQDEEEIAAGLKRLATAKEELARLPEPPPGAPEPVAVEPLVEAWEAAWRECEKAATACEGARTQIAKIREQLGGSASATTRTPDRDAIARLAGLYVEMEAARARRQAAGQLLLDPALAGSDGPVDDAALRSAWAAVDRWLEAATASWAWPAVVVIAGAAAIVLAALSPMNVPAILAAVAAAAGGVVQLTRALCQARAATRRADEARRALVDAGITEAVPDRQAAVAACNRRQQVAARSAAAAAWRAHLQTEQRSAAAVEDEKKSGAATLLESCGLGRDLTGAGVLHDAPLLANLFEADAELARCEAEFQARRVQADETAARVRDTLARAGIDITGVAEPASARGALEAWRERLRARALFQSSAQRESESVAAAERRRATAQEDLLRLRRRLGLNEDGSQDDHVRELHARHGAWRTAAAARDSADAALSLARRAAEPELLELTPARLDVLLAEAQVADARKEELHRQIAELDAESRQARESRQYEEALAAVERARDDLAEDRAVARRAALADAMLEDLRARTASSRPAVLEKASGHLRAFTRGDHQLELVTGQVGTEPSFAAVDTRTRERQSLDQLSDGTRTQLLLAVRLAFIETLEDDRPLPLFLDEALTTTDDDRFDAIAGALGDLARPDVGRPARQVFYLTSQPHDAGAWERALAKRGLPAPQVLDLAAARGLAAAAPAAQLPPAAPAPVPRPAPGPEGLAAYRLALRVPPLDPYRGSDGQHVDWLLLDDAELLYRLETARTTLVGRVLSTRASLVQWKVLDDATAGAIAQRARILEAFCACWRIGRGRPVTVEDIDGSGAVSSTMRPRIVELLANVGGDARRFDAGLDSVPRLQKSVATELREYLRDNGVIPDRDPLDATALLDRVLADLGLHADRNPGQKPTRELVQDCVARWWQAAAMAPEGD